MKKFTAALLAAALLLLAACARENPLVGSWSMQTAYEDLTGSVPAGEELGNLDGYVSFDSLYLTSVYTFGEDGSYVCRADVEQYIKDCRMVWIDAINAYYADQIAQRNLDITVEEAWELDGISAETLVDADEIRAALAGVNRSGNYEARDGKLYLSAGSEYRVDSNVYTEFTVSGDTLTLTAAVGGESELQFPAILTRVTYE